MQQTEVDMGFKAVLRAVTGIAAVAIPGVVNATEGDLSGGLPAQPAWRLEAAGSYAVTSGFGGWGVALRGGWAPAPTFQFGLAVETARLHAEGSFQWQELSPLSNAVTTMTVAYSQTFSSTLIGAYARFPFPSTYVTPYFEVAAGALLIGKGDEKNVACHYGNGLGVSASGGLDVHAIRSVAVGARVGVRNPGWGSACTAQGGVWQGSDALVMAVGSLTASYRW